MLLSVCPFVRLSAQTPAGIPGWVGTYVASEVRGERFAHAWLGKARGVASVQAALAAGLAPPAGPRDLRGTFRTVVVAATYADRTPAFQPAQYDSLFFGAGGFRGGYSLRSYFEELSGGRFRIAGDVTDWVPLPQSWAYYINDFAGGRGRWKDYVRDALARADETVDWRQYDNDGPDGVPDSGDDDGFVDLVVFLHPLADGVCRRDELAGPVATGYYLGAPGALGSAFTTRRIGANGRAIEVDDFVLTAGLDCDDVAAIATINIPAHELGHALGLPDLNDLDRSSMGVGVWDLMGYGLYAGRGRPAALGAWCRWQLGWGSVVNVVESGAFVLPPAVSGRTALRVKIPGTREYYLVENRRREGIDAALPGAGLIVWHIDADSMARYAPLYRGTENDTHPGIAVVRQAPGYGTGADPFPGLGGNATLGAATLPSAATFRGLFAGVVLDSMGAAPGGAAGDMRVVVRYTAPVALQDVVLGGELVVGHLTGQGGRLTPEQEQSLDGLGNRNGALDIGDVAAWLDRRPLALSAAQRRRLGLE